MRYNEFFDDESLEENGGGVGVVEWLMVLPCAAFLAVVFACRGIKRAFGFSPKM